MARLKEGDVVRLNSGGDPMTVVDVENNSVSCAWFSVIAILDIPGNPTHTYNTILQTGTFKPRCLTKVKKEETDEE